MPGLIQDGSNVVTQGLLSSVPESCVIDLLCCRITGREQTHAAAQPGRFRRIEIARPDNAGSLPRRLAYRAAYSLLSHAMRTPRGVYYETGRAIRRSLDRMLDETQYDRIVAEYYCTARLLAPDAGRATLVLQDADHVTLDIQATKEPSLLARLDLRYRAAQMRSYLARELGAIDRLVTLSEHDRMAYERLGLRNVRSVSVPMPPLPTAAPDLSGQAIVFLGSVDYLPNRDGLEWFLHHVFPLVRREIPGARLKVIGGGRGAAYDDLARIDGVDLVGWVPMQDIDAHFDDVALTVAPLWLGTGVKTKVLDLMWKGLPVVGTTIAGRGTPAEHGGAVTADTPEAFAAGVVELLSSRPRRVACRESAWDLLTENHICPAALDRTFQTIMGGN